MTEDWDVQQRTEYNLIRWRYENDKKISKHSDEDGETLERFYNRINLDEKRRKILDDSKKMTPQRHLETFRGTLIKFR
jgi:hypothetical protein